MGTWLFAPYFSFPVSWARRFLIYRCAPAENAHYMKLVRWLTSLSIFFPSYHMRGSRWGGGGLDPLRDTKDYGFLAILLRKPLKTHMATKPAFNVGPSSAR